MSKTPINMPEKEHKRAHKKRQKQDLLNKVLYLIDLVVHVSLTSEYWYLYPIPFRKFCQQKTGNSKL